MNKRIYNISFDLHTVSGIVICVLLYVIFFAGTFSFFRAEIINWERNEPVTVRRVLNVNVDSVLTQLKQNYSLYGRDITIRRNSDERNVTVNISDSKHAADTIPGEYYYFDPKTSTMYDYEHSYTLGEFLYRLHFFAQIPYPWGYWLSGFTALFFLFAIVTGVIVHWEKLVKNFYVFRPWAKLKTMWTDAHTVLGTIGLPFQAVYAVTGAYFMIRIFLLIPTVLVLYNGDDEKIYEELGVELPHYKFVDQPLTSVPPLNPLVGQSAGRWSDYTVTQFDIFNYGDSNMHVAVSGELDKTVRFTGNGQVVYHAPGMEVVTVKDPFTSATYVEGVLNSLTRLHYGDYGGYALKVVSFMLGLISCFVILSGILIWLEARNKLSVPDKTRRFNERVGHIYLAICLGMYPVTALTFVVMKLIPYELDTIRETIVNSVYFGSWLLVAIIFTIVKNNSITNRYTLIGGVVIGLLVPITTGLFNHTWFWNSFANGQYDMFIVDAMWICLSTMAGYALYKMRKPAVLVVQAN